MLFSISSQGKDKHQQFSPTSDRISCLSCGLLLLDILGPFKVKFQFEKLRAGITNVKTINISISKRLSALFNNRGSRSIILSITGNSIFREREETSLALVYSHQFQMFKTCFRLK